MQTTKELLDIATSHASGEEVVGAIFDRLKGKAKRDEDVVKGASNRPNKKKNKQQREDSLMATADRNRGRNPTEGILDHFQEVARRAMPEPCFPHQAPIQELCPHEAVLI